MTSYVIFEATIINTLVSYWGYDLSPAILITVSLLFYFGVNVYRADLFGEVECELAGSSVKIPWKLTISLVGSWQSITRCWIDLVHLCHHGRREPS